MVDDDDGVVCGDDDDRRVWVKWEWMRGALPCAWGKLAPGTIGGWLKVKYKWVLINY